MLNENNIGRDPLITLRSDKGFSLLEVVIAMALFTMIIAVIVQSKNDQTENYMSQNQIIEMQQSLRASMIILTQEIRKVGFDPYSDTLGVGFTNCGANSLTFNYVDDNDGSDSDGDGFVDEKREMETVTFSIVGTQLMWNRGNALAIAENVQGLTFTYLNGSGNVTVTPLADATSVRISVTVFPDARFRYESGNNRTLTTLVNCRNI